MQHQQKGRLEIQEIKACLQPSAQPNCHSVVEFPELQTYLSSPPRLAAVLIPFLMKEDGWHLLLTRRTTELQEHSGQVAFPGGRKDPSDESPYATALREAQEEIGLAPQDVQVLGRLSDYLTVTNYLVTPVVGVIPWPYTFHLSPHEVSRIFSVPLTWLTEPAHHEVRQVSIPGWEQPIPVVYFQPYDSEVLWGASARFTLGLLEALNMINAGR